MNLDYEFIAEKYAVSISAVEHLAKAITLGHGQQAQFNHPDLGGMGQWMPTMLMIGDIFNHQLKAKVDAICHELAQAYCEGNLEPNFPMKPMQITKWWSDEYEASPSFVGGQNDLRYAYFADKHHLIVKTSTKVTYYNTPPYQLTGVSQQQASNMNQLVFHTSSGQPVTLTHFKQFEE